MSPAKRQQNRRRSKKKTQLDLWRPVPRLDPPEPIEPAGDPTALLRSLGPPPLPGQGPIAEQHLALVVDKAARLAEALAKSADLLADGDGDADDSGMAPPDG